MAALSDSSFGLANESTFKTYVAPTRWYEVIDPQFDVNKSVKQGRGLRVGTRMDRSGRRVVTSADATGETTVELVSKGLGLLLESCLGTATSTLVSGTTYQQLFTAATGITIPTRTLQTGVIDATGTVNAVSYLGSMVSSWELDIPSDDIATLKVKWDCADWTTAQAYAAPSYPANPVSIFHWGQAAFTLGGTPTVPTTTALLTGGTANTAIRSLKLTGDNMAQAQRLNSGGSGRKSRQLIGDFKVTGELELEYVDNVVRDAYLADTALALSATLTSSEALSTGTATFQILAPEIKLNGEVPKANGSDLPVLKVPFDVLDGQVAAAGLYMAIRTADSAL